MEELSLFKDYITLDDSYFNFVELVDEEGYSICLKEGIDLKEEIKIFIPSLYKNKPIKKLKGLALKMKK